MSSPTRPIIPLKKRNQMDQLSDSKQTPQFSFKGNRDPILFPNMDANQSNQQDNQYNHTMTQINPYAQQQINQGIAQGFGQYFFNALDPNIAKTNIPIKQPSSMHAPVIFGTILMIGGIIAGIILVNNPNLLNAAIALFVAPYCIYLIISIKLSSIHGYITNLKKFDDYQQTYDKMVKGKGYFRFYIQCYHYKTVKTKNGTRRQRVVTHTATQNFFPRQCFDQSGDIKGIKDITKYVFINYHKKFYFTDSASQSRYSGAYSSFISRNRRDQHQTYSQTFELEGFEPEVGFCMMGQSPHNSIIFYLITFLGLALPYSCIIQRSVSRYSINILKRLTC